MGVQAGTGRRAFRCAGRWGAFTQINMFSERFVRAMEDNLHEAVYVEVFVPLVCQQFLPSCRVGTVGTLKDESVGFNNNGGNAFSGERSSVNFRDIVTSRAVNKWYHPVG